MRWVCIVAAASLLTLSCGGDDTDSDATTTAPAVTLSSSSSTTSTAASTTSTAASTTSTTVAVEAPVAVEVTEVNGLVYLADDAGSWTLNVAYPDTDGPWPLIVVIPEVTGADRAVAAELVERGAVVISGEDWAPAEAWVSDPAPHLYGVMDRAACIVSWAQAHADEYGANPELTTVTGRSGGAMAAAWVGLGLADDSKCDDPIAHLPVALVAGESQFLFHSERWDPYFESGDPEPIDTLDGLINPARWEVSPDLGVALWSATNPIGETRAVENPPGDDSWVWIREVASPHVDDLAAVGAFDDEQIDWADNARLMELRMKDAGINVRNEVYDIGHAYTDEVYDLIFSIQP